MRSYQLYIHLSRPAVITIGRLGALEWPPGGYIYTGSARKNPLARVTRHLSQTKLLKWHIDYFLAHEAAAITDVRFFDEEECRLNQATPGRILLARFGASDCRHGCGSHFKYLPGA